MNNSTPIIEEYRTPVFDPEDPLIIASVPVTCVCGCVKC